MYTDIPQFTRCCFCLPLRPGLIAWGYIKLVFNILMLIFATYHLHIILTLEYTISKKPVIVLTTMTFVSIVDIVFGLIFLVSAHMKHHKIMKIYYKYCVVMLILTILFVVAFLIYVCVQIGDISKAPVPHYIFFDVVKTLVEATISVLFNAIIFIYMVLLVRSEVLKLENNLNCKFVNPMCAGADEGKELREATDYDSNMLSSDPGSVTV